MARRDIPMNEVVETIYQWHKGMRIQQHTNGVRSCNRTFAEGVVMSLCDCKT